MGTVLLRLVYSLNYFVTRGADRQPNPEIWKPWCWTLERELKGHMGPISSITFAHSDTILASTTLTSGSIRIWNAQKGTPLHQFPTGSSVCVRVIGSPYHPLILAFDPMTRAGETYDAELGEPCQQPKFTGHAVFTPDGAGFISGSGSEHMTTWDFRPSLAHRERIVKGKLPSWNGKNPMLSGTRIDGPRVT